MGATVTVVVPNYNGEALLAACLGSLRRQTYRDFGVVVVDDGSTDGSVALVRKEFPEVTVVPLPENRGFAAATNAGIRAAPSPFIATLNNDAEPAPGWLEALMAEVQSSPPTVGMWASKITLYPAGEIVDSCGIYVDRAGIAWDAVGGEPDPGDAPLDVFGPCAAAALYRRLMLDQVGLFDERFFAYLEDVDLAWRARLAGWGCRYVPGATVLHRHSATAREGSSFKSYHLGRNKVWTIVKNYPTPLLWIMLPAIALFDGAAVFYAVAARGDVAALKGRWAGLTSTGIALEGRRRVQSCPRISSRQLWSMLQPLEWPWRVRARYQHLSRLQPSSIANPTGPDLPTPGLGDAGLS